MMLPIQLFLSVLVGYLSKDKPLTLLHRYFVVRMLIDVAYMLFIAYADNDGGWFFTIQVYFFFLGYASSASIKAVAINTFFRKIQNREAGGTYITFLFTMMNMGAYWPKLIDFYVVDTFGYFWCEAASKCVCVVYLIATFSVFRRLEKVPYEEWQAKSEEVETKKDK